MNEKPHLSFFGSSLVSSYWNGAATYYRGMLRALARRGYRITFFEPDAYQRQQHRDIPNPDWVEVIVYSAADPRTALDMVERASNSDIVVKASGIGVHDQLLESAVLEMRRPRQEILFWDVDAPATLERMQNDPHDAFRSLVGRYDLVLTYGGGERVAQDYRNFGAKRCVPIYNALDPDTHYRVAPDLRFGCDLALLANRLPDREARVDEFFFKAVTRLPRRRFLLGGAGWDDKERAVNLDYVGHVPTTEHNALNSSALAILNVARDSMARYGFSPATRVFEAAGAGACIVTDAWIGIEHFLEPGREILVAESGDEVAEILSSLGPSAAHAVGRAARVRILARHTYAHRALEFEALVDSCPSPAARALSANRAAAIRGA